MQLIATVSPKIPGFHTPWRPGNIENGSGNPLMNIAPIRPALHSLQRMPTIHQVAEQWGKLELKLETRDTRYWVTTEGVPCKMSGTPINYVVDYVTVEKLADDGNWTLKAVYSPEAWKLSQAFDYCQMIYADLHRLNAKLETQFRWETVRELEALQRELELTNRIIFELSEKVRTRWT